MWSLSNKYARSSAISNARRLNRLTLTGLVEGFAITGILSECLNKCTDLLKDGVYNFVAEVTVILACKRHIKTHSLIRRKSNPLLINPY